MTRRLGGRNKSLAAIASLSLATTLACVGATTGCGSSKGSQTTQPEAGMEGGFADVIVEDAPEDSPVITPMPDTGPMMEAAVMEVAPQLGTPTFMPPDGTTFTGPTNVTIVPPAGFPTSGFIYYTTNGTNPNPNSLVYVGPIQVSQTEQIRAYAAAPGYMDSAVGHASYTVTAPISDAGPDAPPPALTEPALTPGSSVQNNDFKVSASASNGATICYTLDGVTTPTCNGSGACTGSSLQYNSVTQIAINGSVTSTTTPGSAKVQAIACASGVATSPVASQTYVLTVAPPAFSNPAAGTILLGSTPIVSSTTSGATISYTTNGSAPTCINGTAGVGTGVSDPHTFQNANGQTDGVVASTTFQTIGCKPGYAPSTVSTSAFTVQLNPLAFPAVASQTSGGPYAGAAGPGTYDNYVTNVLFLDATNDTGAYPVPASAKEWACYTLDGSTPACGTTAPSGTSVAGACSANVPTGGCNGGGGTTGCGVIRGPAATASNDNGSTHGTISSTGTTLTIIDCGVGYVGSATVSGAYTLQLDPPDINLPGVQGEQTTCPTYGAPLLTYAIPANETTTFTAEVEQDGPAVTSITYGYVCVAEGATPACGNGACAAGTQIGTGFDYRQCDDSGPTIPPTGVIASGDSWSVIGCPAQGVNFAPSAVTTVSFTGPGVASPPQIAPSSGTLNNPVTVTITNTDTTAGGSTICYTEDGTTPTCSNGACTHGQTQHLAAAGAASINAVSPSTVTAGGSGYTTAPSVNLTGGGATTQSTYTSTLTITGYTITNGGSGYTSPTNCIQIGDPNFSGFGAYVDTVISPTGSISALTFDTGCGGTAPYSTVNGAIGFGRDYTAPVITLPPPNSTTGTQATATITGSVDELFVTTPQADYSTPPTVAFSSGGGSGAAASLVTSNGFQPAAIGCNVASPSCAFSTTNANTIEATACNATEAPPATPVTATFTFTLAQPNVTSSGGSLGNLNSATTIGAGQVICISTPSNFTNTDDGSSQLNITFGSTAVNCGSGLPAGATPDGAGCPTGSVAITVPTATNFTVNAIACGSSDTTQNSSPVRSVAFETVTTSAPVITTNQTVLTAGIAGCQPSNTGNQADGDNCTPQSPWYNPFQAFLFSATPSAQICYSETATAPSCNAGGTCNSGTPYTGGIMIATSGTTLQAIACNVTTGASALTPVSTFTLDVSPVIAYPVETTCGTASCGNGIDLGFYDTNTNASCNNTEVTNAVNALGGATLGAVICYTTDGSAPGCTTGSGSNHSTTCAAANSNALNPTAGSTAFTGMISTTFTLNWQACLSGFVPATGGQNVSSAAYRHQGTITLDGTLTDWNASAEEVDGDAYFTYDASNFYFALAGIDTGAGTDVVIYLGANGPSAVGATHRPPNLGTTAGANFSASEGIMYAIEWATSPGTAAPVVYAWNSNTGWSATSIAVSFGYSVSLDNLTLSVPIASLPLLGSPPGPLHVSENEYTNLATTPTYDGFWGSFNPNYESCVDPNGN